MGGEFLIQHLDQSTVLVVDGALTLEMVVVLGNLDHPFAGNVSASQDIFKERNHVVRPLGATEGDDDEGVVGDGSSRGIGGGSFQYDFSSGGTGGSASSVGGGPRVLDSLPRSSQTTTALHWETMADFPVAVITDEFTQDFDLLCRTAVELGVSGLEVRTIWNKNVVDMSDSEIEEVGRMARAANLTVCSIASPVFKCMLPGGGDIDHRFEQDAFHSAHAYEDQPRILGRALDIAEALGADIVRVFSFWRTVEPSAVTRRVVETLEGAAEAAASRNARIGLENEHACNVATGAETAAVLAAIDHPNLGVVWDPANAYVSGRALFPRVTSDCRRVGCCIFTPKTAFCRREATVCSGESWARAKSIGGAT